MKYLSLLLSLLFTTNLFAQDPQAVEDYIEQYKQLAIEEQIRSGVPAAITLAQGIHESDAGKSELATQAHNHFGIKCKSTWTGQTYTHTDDRPDECFRKYPSNKDSYTDHSDFLKNNNRYHFLFDIDVTDYKAWASGLKRAGYATNPAYVKRLTDLVEKYNLQQYTFEARNKQFATNNQQGREVVPENDKETIKEEIATKQPEIKKEINAEPTTNYYKGLKGFFAKKGEMLLQQSIEYNIRYARLLQINDLEDAPLPADMFVFTEKKRKVGTVEFHTVLSGETMQIIAQKEAMLLENLYSFNNMEEDVEVAVGEQLNLQYKAVGTPKLRTKFLETIAVKETSPVITPEKIKEEIKNPIVVAKEIKEEVLIPKEEIKKVEQVEIEQKPIAKMEEVKEEVLNKEEIAKIETIKEEFKKEDTKPLIIESPKEEIITPKEEVITKTVIDENSPITDLEKAKRIEALLTNEKKVENDIVLKTVEEKIEPTPIAEEKIAEEKKEAKQITEEIKKPIETPAVTKVIAQAPKRNYNEKNVSDETKKLKQKFDEFVYKPLPERKKIEVTPTGIIRDTTKKEIIKKEVVPAKKETSSVKKTTTGIVRETPKIEKKKEQKETVATKEKTTTKKTDQKKEPVKKVTEKKVAEKSKTKENTSKAKDTAKKTTKPETKKVEKTKPKEKSKK